ncbi:hypothetical protein CHS0354_041042 [Potamilus streckersoni]|uniref:Mannosyltransferase n=1 Tax=Potamilus streckersoni TaxID=2493646 RepID=A0AAE0SDE7_9BIVA|nr:hypothetical protein CHS0354_041042 [Potamilus streckersoni]
MRRLETLDILVGALSLCTWILYTKVEDCFLSRESRYVCPTKSQFSKRLKANSLDEIPKDLDFIDGPQSDGRIRIPKIMHQFVNKKVTNTSLSKTIINVDSSWEYIVWTREKRHTFVHEKFKDITPFYDGYRKQEFRDEAIQYMILFEFGGVYADSGWKLLRPLDKILQTFACFFGQVWHEESILTFHIPRLLSDTLMGCQRGHPFMKILIENLPSFYSMPAWAPASTGLYYVSFHYKHYIADNDNLSLENDNGVHLLSPEYFFQQISDKKMNEMKKKCEIQGLSGVQKWACASIFSPGFTRQASNSSFAVRI